MRKLSVTVITFNEAEKIGRALSSVSGLADEIVIVDSFSTDDTERICRGFTDRFLQVEWRGYRAQKQYALEQASYEWVLSLDGDEALSPALIQELQGWKQGHEKNVDGYYLPRLNLFMGRWIRHTSWYPDWQLRLFRRSRGEWAGGRVHESVRLSGNTDRFRHPLQHYSYSDISEYLSQLQNFSGLAAADYFESGRKTGPFRLVVHPLVEFLRNYVLYRGFQDGVPGLAVSVLSSMSVFFKFLKLWELQSEPEQKHLSAGS